MHQAFHHIRKTIFLLSVFAFAGLWSCNTDGDTKRFTDTYGQILLMREQNSDTSIANPKVDSVLKANNYTKLSFKQKFQDLSSNPESFRKMIDSVHASVEHHR